MFQNQFQPVLAAASFVTMLFIAAGALVGLGATGMAFAGLLSWPQIAFTYDGQAVPWAGQALQIGVTALLLGLLAILPATVRVLKLEASHRRFEMNMDDVTRAYRAAHMADRAEMFEMQREFDAVRERYRYLTKRPELAEMDDELLTMAAQMSHLSRHFAESFSEEKTARARESLKQRLADAETLDNRIQEAYAATREIRRLLDDVDAEESAVIAQLHRLREEVASLGLPETAGDRPRLVVS